jgi:hypothetical protein
MPFEQGVRLHDHEGLLPRSNHMSQQDEEDAIGPGDSWPFHLPFEDDERLSQEGIFGYQLGLASAKVGQRLQRQGGSERFGPMSKARRECLQATHLQPLESGEHTTHTKSFSIIEEYRC